MASVTLEGPYPFTADTIATVGTRRSPGSFVLGHITDTGTFDPRLVGRSDADVIQELKLLVRLLERYNGFKFRYTTTPEEAFIQQCHDFHDCGECSTLENKHHPTRPSHTHWLCPICGKDFLNE